MMEKEENAAEMKKFELGLIHIYNHEIQSLIGSELQQLLVIVYNEGNEYSQRKIQEYCYKILKKKNLLWEDHQGDYRNIHLLKNSLYL